jgi:hypothetical protein
MLTLLTPLLSEQMKLFFVKVLGMLGYWEMHVT